MSNTLQGSETDKITEMLAPVFKKNKTVKVVMFGSHSRHAQTGKSDLDLMIIIDTDKRFFERYEQFNAIHDIISNRPVDMLIYTPKELIAISHRPFIKRILTEGKTIYES